MQSFDTFWTDLLSLVSEGASIRTAGRSGKPNTYTLENGVISVRAEGGAPRALPQATFRRAWKHLHESGRLDRNTCGITSNSSAVFALIASLPYIQTVSVSPLILAPKED